MGKIYDFIVKGLNFSQCPKCEYCYPLRKNPKKTGIRVCPKCHNTYYSEPAKS